MGQLIGLKGVTRDIDCLFIEKGADINVLLNNEYAATAAGQYGAINIWKDDEDKIRCEAMRHFSLLESKTFTTIKQAERWADKWIKKINP